MPRSMMRGSARGCGSPSMAWLLWAVAALCAAEASVAPQQGLPAELLQQLGLDGLRSSLEARAAEHTHGCTGARGARASHTIPFAQ